MKNWSLAASAAVLLLTAGCATQRAPSTDTMGASPAASPGVSAAPSAGSGSGTGTVWPVHVGHPWTAGGPGKGSGPVHVGNPWTATWNMPAPPAPEIVQAAAPAPAPVAAPAPAPVIAPAPAPEPPPLPQRRAPRAARG